ncbi:MAG TPA: hypothetical protein V6D22_20660 [Candidatus Obscuribacterales bacterium]
MKIKTNKRNQRGATHIAEFAAALVIGLPLLTLLVFVALECGHFYTIKSAMELGARNAARALVVYYNVNHSTTPASSATFFSDFFIPNYINSATQFTYIWDTANTPPQYVTVSCAYPSGGGNGLAPFPAGPLRYLSNASFDLGTFTVRGTFTLPVQ